MHIQVLPHSSVRKLIGDTPKSGNWQAITDPGISRGPVSLMRMWVCSVRKGNVENTNKALNSHVLSMIPDMH